MATTFTSITVRELIERLSAQDPDAEVIFSTDYGDRTHTEQALPVRGKLEEVTIKRTCYSTSGYAVVDPNLDEDESDDTQTFLLVR